MRACPRVNDREVLVCGRFVGAVVQCGVVSGLWGQGGWAGPGRGRGGGGGQVDGGSEVLRVE